MEESIERADEVAIEGPGASTEAAPGLESAAHLRTQRGIFFFWAPLAIQWLMMAAEGPFLAAIIARMAEPAHNLAAYGIAIAFAILLESPVIMLMSASTALVEDSESYRRLRNFANTLNLGATSLVLVLLIPPIFDWVTDTLLGVPAPVRSLVYGSVWLLLPWPGAIGYRRFLHGILIRSGRTRLVAYGTVLRLAAMGVTGFLLYRYTSMHGAWVGALGLSAGVTIEAIAAHFMARGEVRRLQSVPPRTAPAETLATADDGGEVEIAEPSAKGILARGEDALRRTGAAARARVRRRIGIRGYGDIARFYFPLALTSLIGLTVQPLLTFFMGRAPLPIESLAVFPVVHALSFLFRAPGLAFQEVVIALAGKDLENIAPIRNFGIALGVTASLGLALVTFTPLAGIWYGVVSGLPADLTALAAEPSRIMVPLPALTVLMALQQGVLVLTRRTRAITAASVFEIVGIAALFTLLGWRYGVFGASAAMVGLVGGRLLANGYLWARIRSFSAA